MNILAIIFFQILFSVLFLINDMPRIRKFLYNLTQQFMKYLSKNKQNENIKNPPKKVQQIPVFLLIIMIKTSLL